MGAGRTNRQAITDNSHISGPSSLFPHSLQGDTKGPWSPLSVPHLVAFIVLLYPYGVVYPGLFTFSFCFSLGSWSLAPMSCHVNVSSLVKAGPRFRPGSAFLSG